VKIPKSSPYGFAGDGKIYRRVLQHKHFKKNLVLCKNKLEPISDKLKEGPGKTPTAIAFSPAMIAAKRCKRKSMTS
jgi:hypothetical protein